MLLSKIQVLFVDDHRDTTYIIGRQLEGMGHDVDCTLDSLDAMLLANSKHYDVYILDIIMPGHDGIDLCVHLKALNPEIPVIFYSAVAEQTSITRALAHGGDCYLVKPVSRNDLEAALKKFVTLKEKSGDFN